MSPPPSKRGFALLITITLLAFLVLLLVSLASLTRIETQVASNSQSITKARQNALFALNIALGQLQSFAGPDQRVTATAGIFDPVTSNATALNGLAAPLDGSRNWTGVWGNPDAPDRIYGKTPTPVLLNWLVSGNENTPTALAASDGHISTPSTTAAAVAIKPSDALHPPADNDEWSLLVGPGTVAAPAAYVVAKLRKIESSSLPGFDPGEVHSIGRYAWWVGDEGVKARYNLRDAHAPAPGLSPPDLTTTTGRQRSAVSQRNGIERITGFASLTSLVNAPSLESVLTNGQIALLDPSLSVDETIVKRRFHDLTAHSEGILANSLRGGLREDLSYHLAHPPAQGGKTGSLLPTNDSIFPEASRLKGPSWEYLRSFYSQAAAAPSASARAIVLTDANTHGIFPVLVQMRNKLRLRIDASGACFLRLAPVFVLGNPHSVSISGQIDLRYYSNAASGGSAPSLQVELLTGITNEATEVARNTASPASATNLRMVTQWIRDGNTSGTRSILGQLILRTPEFTFAPGELKVFSLANNATLPSGNSVTGPITLVEDDPSPDIYLDIPTAGVVPATSLQNAGNTEIWSISTQGSGSFHVALYPSGAAGGNPATVEAFQRIEDLGMFASSPKPKNILKNGNVPSALPWETDAVYTQYFLRMPAETAGTRLRRLYADYNIRAKRVRRPASQFATSATQNNPLFNVADSPSTVSFTTDLATPRWGNNYQLSSADPGNERVVLFDPVQSDDPATPLLSLGALQHVDLTADEYGASTSVQPGNAFGNSRAHPYVPRSFPAERRSTTISSGTLSESYYDISYLLNTALWDSTFFSTVPQTVGASLPAPLPNGRLQPLVTDLADLQDGARAAARLMINGAFNVNSTSIEAWKAVFTGLRIGSDDTRHLRSLHQPLGNGASGVGDSAYAGFRALTDNEIDLLAAEMVGQVRRRGPFLSLAHFVNRALVPGPASASSSETSQTLLGLKGALQTALDLTVNTGFPASLNHTQSDNQGGAYADPQAASGVKATGIPGWLNQADLLQTLGPTLSARSDTFTIRTYGESMDPAASASISTGRAWCEAVVQRVIQPVNRKNPSPASADYNEPATATAAQPDFGRRFQIVSFRWLSPADL